ncbi:hypothetical protein LTR37_013460 [Vermiconidia calcicola]|uniref:Uncharacterized protein n=1 Tax=Vermiconidia calcicola TaxID=1690605 RepID=A0ACC3MWE0_9PEZI|nr:hypothetical protein LTR37_013460 [Vermiconidia calcicola]
MFKPHTDTEKADRMFGTLAVCPACKHTGGDVEVSFNGKTATLSTATTSEWSGSYLAWYADVMHEVKPVVSGYRIVLTFNLVYAGPGVRTICAGQDTHETGLKSLLLQWGKSADQIGFIPQFYIYLPEHKYSDASLSLDRLKSVDYKRVQTVASLLQDTGFECYLATLEKEDRDFEEESIRLTRVVALDGAQVLEDVPIEEADIVQQDAFDRDPDDEETGGWTGNEGCESTLWYRNSAMVLFPRKYHAEFLMRPYQPQKDYVSGSYDTPPHDIRELFDSEVGKYRSDPSDTEQKDILVRICGNVIGHNRAVIPMNQSSTPPKQHPHNQLPYCDHTMGLVANYCLELNSMDLVKDAVRAVKKHIPLETISGSTSQFRKHNFSELRECLDAITTSLPDVEGRLNVCNMLASGYDSHSNEDRSAAAAWKTEQEDLLLSGTLEVRRTDVAPLVAMAKGRRRNEWIVEK